MRLPTLGLTRPARCAQCDFFLTVQIAVFSLFIFCAVNACDDDAEVLRFLDELDVLAVLPHRMFTVATAWTCGGVLYWLFMDFGSAFFIITAASLGVMLGSQLVVHFLIVRASVSSKAHPVEGPHAAGALRRAASKANLQQLVENSVGGVLGAAATGLQRRRSALRRNGQHGGAEGAGDGTPEEQNNARRRVHFTAIDMPGSAATSRP